MSALAPSLILMLGVFVQGADAGVALLSASAFGDPGIVQQPEVEPDRIVIHYKVRGAGYLEGSPLFDRQKAVNIEKCSTTNHTLILPVDILCPRACAFSQQVYGDPLVKHCVAPSLCSEISSVLIFANPNTLTCTSTCGHEKHEKIPGCALCRSPGVCAMCSDGFELNASGGICTYWMNRYFILLYIFIIVLCLLVAWYLWCLFHRPQINHRNLALALHHRCLDKPSRETMQNGQAVWEAWPASTNLLKENGIAGQGSVLYFRWLTFMIAVALVIFAFTYVGHEYSPYASQAPTPTLQDHLGTLFLSSHSPADVAVETVYEEHPGRMCLTFSLLYCVIVAMSMGMVSLQVGWSSGSHRKLATPADYIVSIKGLPVDLRSPTPLHRHLETVLSQDSKRQVIVGVSLNYDTDGFESRIEDAVDTWTEELDATVESKLCTFTGAEGLKKGMSGGSSLLDQAPEQTDRKGDWRSLDFLDALLVPLLCGSSPDAPRMDNGKQEAQRDLSWVDSIPGSGEAIVVVNTQADAIEMLALLKANSLPAFRYDGKDYSLSLGYVSESQPADILWSNFHPRTKTRLVLESLLVVVLIIIAIFAFALFYIPYAALYMNFIHIPGVSPTTMQGTIIGLLISLGNLIVSTIVEYAVGRASIRDKNYRDVIIMGLAFFATSLNLMADLLLVVQIVNGAQVDKAFAGTMAGYDRELSSNLYDLIIPGYLLIPILLLPLFQIAVPYWLCRGLVGSRRFGRRQSEKALQHPSFDIVWRFADALTNTLIVCTLGAFTSPRMWMVSLWLALWFVLAIVIDRSVLLRHSSQTWYHSCLTSNAFIFFWSIPTGCLAGLAAFWGYKYGIVPWMWMIPFVGCVHIILYVCAARWAISKRADWREESLAQLPKQFAHVYAERLANGNPMTYFNTNQVFCLRTKAEALKQLPPGTSGWDVLMSHHRNSADCLGCAPYVEGKAYLQPGEATTFQEGLTAGLVDTLAAQEQRLEGAITSATGALHFGSTHSESRQSWRG